MHLTLITNPDESKIILYKVARIIYAETNASSLLAIESLAAMIANLCVTSQRQLCDLIKDKNIFESLNINSNRHGHLYINSENPKFKICLRVAQKMINGALPDCCNGAVRFHRVENLPDWAVSRGYIAEVDELLFYL